MHGPKIFGLGQNKVLNLMYCWYGQQLWDFPQADLKVKVTANIWSNSVMCAACILLVLSIEAPLTSDPRARLKSIVLPEGNKGNLLFYNYSSRAILFLAVDDVFYLLHNKKEKY